MRVTVTVHYFGPAKDAAGAASERLALGDDDAAGSGGGGVAPAPTAAALLALLGARYPHAAALLLHSCVLARNDAYLDHAAPLADGDHVAVIPPVSGG